MADETNDSPLSFVRGAWLVRTTIAPRSLCLDLDDDDTRMEQATAGLHCQNLQTLPVMICYACLGLSVSSTTKTKLEYF